MSAGKPIDWAGLLKWSLRYNDGTAPASRMNAEDMEFLQNAVRDTLANTENPNETIMQAAEKLGDQSSALVITALDVIERCVDFYPEVPRNFYKINALPPLLSTLKSDDKTIVCKTLSILASIFSNNPGVQEYALKEKALPALTDCMEKHSSPDVHAKCIGTVSALIRNYKDAEIEFVANGGLSYLVKGVASDNLRFQEKSMSLLRHLVSRNQVRFELIEQHRLVSVILNVLECSELQETGIQFGELCGQLIESLIEAHRYRLARCGALEAIRSVVLGRLDYLIEFEKDEGWDLNEEQSICRLIISRSIYPVKRITSTAKW